MKIYYYLFYTLYNLGEYVSSPKIWSDAKAALTICVLELFVVFSLIIYYRTLIDKNSRLGEGITFIALCLIFIVTPNTLLFVFSNKWREAAGEFDKWPEQKNEKGKIIVWCIIALVIINFVVACNIPH